MKTTAQETRIYKSLRNGWTAETTYKNIGGKDWQINTLKRSGGRISTIAQAGNATDSGFSFMMFSDKTIKLTDEKVSATEKAVYEIHLKGLAIFDQMKEAGEFGTPENKPYEIEEGQILFLNGYGQDEYHHERKAVYKIEKGQYGIKYHTVNLETLALSVHDHVRNITEKFGIGIYYKEGDKISSEELANYVIDAKEKQTSFNRKNDAEKILNDAAREAKIEEGKKIVSIPENAKSVIVASLYQDDSDGQTDYFSTSVSKTIYLAFSTTDRNNMAELKKAALRIEETKEFAEGGETLEHTGGHSYLPDYYLGTNRWSGWKVQKLKYSDITKEETRNKIYIAAAEGRYFANEEAKEIEAIKAEGIELVTYSEKAFAIFGNTKPIKDLLKSLGGKFNAYLTNPTTKEKIAGWIFSNKQMEVVKNALNI
jgi:hypothetical protein